MAEDQDSKLYDFTNTPKQVPPPAQKCCEIYVPSRVKAIAFWKNPAESAACFAVFNLCFYLLAFANYTVLSLACFVVTTHLAVSMLTVCGLAAYSRFQTGTAEFQQPRLVEIDGSEVRKVVDSVVATINGGLACYAQLQVVSKPAESVGILFGLYLGAKILGWFSGVCLLYLVGLVFFLVPVGYTNNQALVDKQLEVLRKKAIDAYAAAYKQLPPAVTAHLGEGPATAPSRSGRSKRD